MKNEIHRLNRLLCGTKIASETYGRYIQDMKDKKILNDFKSFKRCYEEYADELCAVIESNGGTPAPNSGFAGKIAKHAYAVRKHDVSALLRSAEKGEIKAIDESERILRQGLSPEGSALVAGHIAKARTHLGEIRREKIKKGIK